MNIEDANNTQNEFPEEEKSATYPNKESTKDTETSQNNNAQEEDTSQLLKDVLEIKAELEKEDRTQQDPATEISTKAETQEDNAQDEAKNETSTPSLSVENTTNQNEVNPEPTVSETLSESENKTTEEAEETKDTEEESEDYSVYGKTTLFEKIKELEQDNSYISNFDKAKDIKAAFDAIIEKERKLALETFKEEGGDEGDFDYKDKEETAFNDIYYKLYKQRNQHYNQLEKQKDDNLKKKEELLDKIRVLTETEESQASIEELKKLQEEWRSTGAVPKMHAKSIWASYKALLDLFYDKRSIYFELKELDRRKNLVKKLALCEKAESLLSYESINQALKELSELHDEYKLIGPIPREDQEATWQRFKTASDKMYDKKRAFIKEKEAERAENYQKKLDLAEQVKTFADFETDRIKEWNAKTKELLELQKQWDTIRAIPRDKIKEVSKAFWTPFKAFFNNKNAFLKTLDEEREGNYQAKIALCEEAEELTEHEDNPKVVANKLKELQRKWKDIGPVPSKFRESIYQRFKSVCDAFFQKRREAYSKQEEGYVENLEQKETLCKEIINTTLEDVQLLEAVLGEFIRRWKAIGFVPRKDKNDIRKKFFESISQFITGIEELETQEKEKYQTFVELELSKENPHAQRRLQRKESDIRNKINDLRNDIDTLKTNISFLANSKGAEKLKQQVEEQIENANEELRKLKARLGAFKDSRKDNDR